MAETERANLSTLTEKYYKNFLSFLGGGEGLYFTGGNQFTLPGIDYFLYASFDAFTIGWEDVI